MAWWHLRVWKAPSAGTLAISRSGGIRSSSSGNMGASPTSLVVKPAARISRACASIPIWVLRQRGPFPPQCLRAFHSPSPSTLIRCRRPAGAMGRPDRDRAYRYSMSSADVTACRSAAPPSPGLSSAALLSTNPLVWRSAMLNRSFIVRHVCMAASPWSGCRPRRPVGVASHDMTGLNHIVSGPRPLSPPLQAGQFRVLSARGAFCSCLPAITLYSRYKFPHTICAAEPGRMLDCCQMSASGPDRQGRFRLLEPARRDNLRRDASP
jgi:hypothetical protein